MYSPSAIWSRPSPASQNQSPRRCGEQFSSLNVLSIHGRTGNAASPSALPAFHCTDEPIVIMSAFSGAPGSFVSPFASRPMRKSAPAAKPRLPSPVQSTKFTASNQVATPVFVLMDRTERMRPISFVFTSFTCSLRNRRMFLSALIIASFLSSS